MPLQHNDMSNALMTAFNWHRSVAFHLIYLYGLSEPFRQTLNIIFILSSQHMTVMLLRNVLLLYWTGA